MIYQVQPKEIEYGDLCLVKKRIVDIVHHHVLMYVCVFVWEGRARGFGFSLQPIWGPRTWVQSRNQAVCLLKVQGRVPNF